MRNSSVLRLVITALLCSIAIVIPMVSPFKIILEPASFTLASHVAIFIAVFISPPTAAAVSLVAALGFFLGGFPIVIVFRAMSHVVFAVTGAWILREDSSVLKSVSKTIVFSLFISVIHAVCELVVAMPFYFSNEMSQGYYQKGFVMSVVLLVGIGTLIHSMVDFFIALAVWKPLSKKFS